MGRDERCGWGRAASWPGRIAVGVLRWEPWPWGAARCHVACASILYQGSGRRNRALTFFSYQVFPLAPRQKSKLWYGNAVPLDTDAKRVGLKPGLYKKEGGRRHDPDKSRDKLYRAPTVRKKSSPPKKAAPTGEERGAVDGRAHGRVQRCRQSLD
jgi:hypothetical protein